MTITRLWHAGCESSGASSALEFDALGGWGATISNGWAKTGTYSLRCGGVGTYVNYGLVNVGVSTRQIRTGFYMKCAGAAGVTYPYLFVVNAAAARLVALKIVASESRVTLEVAGSNQGATANFFPDSDGHHWGVDIKIDSSAGWVKVYRDGIEVLTFAGNTGNADIANVRYGNDLNPQTLAANTYYDNLYLDDTTGEAAPTVPPAYEFMWAAANGNGSNAQWTGSDGNQTDNYALVDEAAQNGNTDYVQASAADLVDTYAMAAPTLPAGYTCSAVCPYPVALKTGVEQVRLCAAVVSGSTLAESLAVNLVTSYAPKLFHRFTVDPDTAAAWGQAGLDAMECGFKSAGTFA